MSTGFRHFDVVLQKTKIAFFFHKITAIPVISLKIPSVIIAIAFSKFSYFFAKTCYIVVDKSPMPALAIINKKIE